MQPVKKKDVTATQRLPSVTHSFFSSKPEHIDCTGNLSITNTAGREPTRLAQREETAMAARSVNVVFNNETDFSMQLTKAHVGRGEWCKNGAPPKTIAARSTGKWCSESNGFMTGTSGNVKYHLADQGTVAVGWNNPFTGSNSYHTSAPKGFVIRQDGGSGENAQVTFSMKAI